jgi:hypothetical protein
LINMVDRQADFGSLLRKSSGGGFIKAMEQFKYRVLLPKEKGAREKVPTVPSDETTVLIAAATNDFSVSVHLTGRANAHCQRSVPVRRYDHFPPVRATSSGNATEWEANYRHDSESGSEAREGGREPCVLAPERSSCSKRVDTVTPSRTGVLENDVSACI